MVLEQYQINEIALSALIIASLIPLALYGFRKFKMYELTNTVLQLQKMEGLAESIHDDDSSREIENNKLILFLVSRTIDQVDKIKSRMYIYPTLAILISIGTAVYILQNQSGSNNTTVLLITSFLIIACAAVYLYKKKEIADYHVFIDSFAEAHGIEGELTQEKLSTIEKVVRPSQSENNI